MTTLAILAAIGWTAFLTLLAVWAFDDKRAKHLRVELTIARGREGIQRRRAERAEALAPGAVVLPFKEVRRG